MTYPPQQPGPYDPRGQQQPPQQPYDPYGQQSGYQGVGGYPGGGYPGGEPPKKSRTGLIIAVVAIAVLVLGGAGTGIYFLTKGDDKGNTASGTNTTSSKPKQTKKSGGSTGRTSDDSEPTSEEGGGGADGPDAVVDAYVEAYETKSFGSVVNDACDAYKEKFGTDTNELEQKLRPYDIKAESDGSPEVSGSTATAKIALELTKDGKTETPKIQIKIVDEGGEWKFCGEESA